jgi:uncharacterized membrane protein YqjE
MAKYSGIPYGMAPGWCYPVFEYGMYVLFLICLYYAAKRGMRDVSYLFGGLAFGLVLEYMEVVLGSYTYGHFMVMLGNAPLQIPFCIGIGWGIIMYTARLFTDRLGLSLLACAALDTILALNIDLSMDIVAYRLHMWNWNWQGTGLNPLTAQWFGIPYGNFVGWQTVVFCYSFFFRFFTLKLMGQKDHVLKWILVTILALLCSLFILYSTEEILFPVLRDIGIAYVHRFIGICVILLVLVVYGWRKRQQSKSDPMLPIEWLVPTFFHVYFGTCFFVLGFYAENTWMTIAAVLNILIGIAIHLSQSLKTTAASLGKPLK